MPDLAKVVLEALEQEDPNILRAACIMSGMLGLSQAERGLIKALGHKSWQVQAEAARALGRIGSQGAAPFLRRLLKASEAELRQKMLAAASGSGGHGEGDEAVHPEVAKQAAIALNRLMPQAAQQVLMAALESGKPELVSAALAGLTNLEAEVVHKPLLELLQSDQTPIRRLATACAGRLRLREAVPRLIELLQDPDGGVRKEAIIALNHIKDKQAIEPISERMDDSDADVRRVAAIALGNSRSRETAVVGALVKGLRDHSPEVRQACLSALANLRAEKALEATVELLADSHEQVSRQAAVTVAALAQARERPDYDQ